jgi:hypothetical protein
MNHGLWNDPSNYFATDKYKNRSNALMMFLYRLRINTINRKCNKLRNTGGQQYEAHDKQRTNQNNKIRIETRIR